MTDEDLKALVLGHDKHIGLMAQSIEHLAGAVGSTNVKMEKILEAIESQILMNNKLDNHEKYTAECFDRIHDKLRLIEKTQREDGCPVLLVEKAKTTVANKRIADLEATHKWVMRLVVGSTIVGLLGLVINVKV